MRIPVIQGMIERRILANYHVDPNVMAQVLPKPFRPQLVCGHAIAGICLIRLAKVRPKRFPIPFGLRSENAAHRIAVEWDSNGNLMNGVYIPRRDTNSRLNTWTGGTLFPGIHHHAKFAVKETDSHLSIAIQSNDQLVRLFVEGSVALQIPKSSAFTDITKASRFFANGSVGYSATRSNDRFDGLELRCDQWQVEALKIDCIESSYFDDTSLFPRGSIAFDSALLMRSIRHEWHGREDLCCSQQP